MNGISFRHGSLFSGIGGFDYASSLMGWENVFHCELNPFCRQVLKYHYPNSVSYEDITKTDFSVYRGRIDIITGGFPCQPYSLAGKRLGKDDERHLWPEMLRVIREVSPKWIVGENVFGIVNWSGGLVFEEVQADLEREGYEVQSYILPAAGVDAPHKRDRVWFVAYSNDKGGGDGHREVQEADGEVSKRNDCAELGNASCGFTQNSNEDGRGGNEWKGESCIGQLGNAGTGDNERIPSDNAEAGVVANADGFRLEQCKDTREVGAGQSKVGREGCESTNAAKANGEVTDASDTEVKGGWGQLQQRQEQGESGGCNSENVDASNTDSGRQSSKEHGEKESGRLAEDGLSSYWQNFPTQSPVCIGNDGISARLDTSAISFPKWRNESIKAAGNAVVPQVVLQIFKAIQAYEDSI
jgi:DNA (cytosine-5)-methyltransferase 1